MNGASGFSLIELLVVLVVVAMIASLVPQGLNRLYQRTTADGSAYAIGAQLRDCSLRALQIQRELLASTAPSADCMLEVASDAELSFASGTKPVFYPDGSSNGSRLVITVADQEFIVLINRITSRVRVRPNDSE